MPALAKVAREKLQSLTQNLHKRELVTSFRTDGINVVRAGKRLISFSCNDYLGLSQHPRIKEAAIAAIQKYGNGAGASRLITGNHPLYEALEPKLAAWKGSEAALVFGSGYLVTIGILPAMVGKGDLILADRLMHACLIDGAQISGAKLLRFKHNDTFDCARLMKAHRASYHHCLIVTEDVFSMDGDAAPLAELRAIAAKHDAWLMSDAAHSLMPPYPAADLIMGTLSKALGSYGGYVCASREAIDYLASVARSLMFSTALPPSVIASAIAALDVIRENPGLVAAPLAKARLFTTALGLPAAQSQIVPIILGEEARTVSAAHMLEEAGFLVAPIRPPTVPKNASRLRFTFSALHADEAILKLAQVITHKKLL